MFFISQYVNNAGFLLISTCNELINPIALSVCYYCNTLYSSTFHTPVVLSYALSLIHTDMTVCNT